MTAIRTLFFDPSGLGATARRFFDSRMLIWLCGISFVLAGLAGGSHSLTLGWWIASTTTFSSAEDERLYDASMILLGFYTLLLCAGLLGLHVLLAKERRWTRRLSALGTLLAVLSGIGFCVGALYEFLVEPSYYSSGVVGALFFAGYFGQPVGVVLLGVAVLWSRGLGRWRMLPLLAGVVGSPLSVIVLWWLFPSSNTLAPGQDARKIFVDALVFASPAVLAGIMWISVGFAVFGFRKREAVLLAKERRTAEDVNLSLARRLYEEAWGTGDIAILDEIAAPDFVDRRRDRPGTGGLKSAILDLHRTFPDLDFSIKEQRADGDTVTTRCFFSGTDRCGLLWYPPTNKHADFTATYTDHFSDGELIEHDGGADTADLLRQLGLTQPVGNDRG